MNNINLSNFSEEELLNYYLSNTEYKHKFQKKGLLADGFLQKYHESLFFFKHFYDDLFEFGNINTCDHIFYFIPGFNGTPGQIKFGMPGILKRYGSNVYLKSLYLEEFSCRYPTWLKYTAVNMQKKRDQIVADLHEMAAHKKKIRVVVSSSGFYDFLAVYPQLKDIKKNLILFWISCAPDSVSQSPWEKLFLKVNGFQFNEHKWFAYPNIEFMKYINPECSPRKRWRFRGQKNYFGKNDLESRFFKLGVMWDYISPSYFNAFLKNNLDIYGQKKEMIDIETYVLAATKDGFWDDSSPKHIRAVLSKYIKNFDVIYKETSHLWVVTPENLNELFRKDKF